MPGEHRFPSPLDVPRDLAEQALSGSFDVGDARIHHITDGIMFGRRRFWFTGIDPALWTAPLGITDPDTEFPVNFGLFVVELAGAVTLVDCGFGPGIHDLGESRGGDEMRHRLREIGIGPDDVDRIVLTHMHYDHCGGLVTDAGTAQARLAFPRSRVLVHAAELAYWTGPDSETDPMGTYVRARILPVIEAGLVTTFDEEAEIAPGVTAIPMAGHTPGHTCVRVTSRGEDCLLVGDLAHHPIHFRHHDWLPEIDADPRASIEARGALAEMAIDLDAIVTGPHMPILTLGRLGRDATGEVTWSRVEPGDASRRPASAKRGGVPRA
ncbi:MBL fold metallo-hydrolase [Pseudonocardia pini]|uniref:MBL fold metallo-hydrolase n=1 Tax=Pseudonocardia pini TaxID=2758030 RepID=UPI0015F06E07|nr:MBL fold metallo-hydrolase [Pseudonocardia pini]